MQVILQMHRYSFRTVGIRGADTPVAPHDDSICVLPRMRVFRWSEPLVVSTRFYTKNRGMLTRTGMAIAASKTNKHCGATDRGLGEAAVRQVLRTLTRLPTRLPERFQTFMPENFVRRSDVSFQPILARLFSAHSAVH
jgi:hypothetical protein